MSETHRTIPDPLWQTWRRATQDPDPLVALGASPAFWQQWAQWQSALVAEALAAGATWEEIGHALGTSRQAAWARFRTDVAEAGGGERPMNEQIAQARAEARERFKDLQGRVRARDDAWRDDRARLQEQMRLVDQQRADDRAALLEEMRALKEKMRAWRDQRRAPGADAPQRPEEATR